MGNKIKKKVSHQHHHSPVVHRHQKNLPKIVIGVNGQMMKNLMMTSEIVNKKNLLRVQPNLRIQKWPLIRSLKLQS